MGRIQVVLSDVIEREFRKWLGKRGFKKGCISKEIEKLIVKRLKGVKL